MLRITGLRLYVYGTKFMISLNVANISSLVNANKSDTYAKCPSVGPFETNYADNTYADGVYFEDCFQIGGTSVDKLTMGLATDTNSAPGIIGLGYVSKEASVGTSDVMYPNLPVQLAKLGHINSVAFSLWLNDQDSSCGSILFGGVDTKRYGGEMIKVPILKNPTLDKYTDYSISLTSLEACSSSGYDHLSSKYLPASVVLDSGATMTYLPPDLTKLIWAEAGAEYRQIGTTRGYAVIPCSSADIDAYFSFGFGGPKGPQINVTMKDLVIDLQFGDMSSSTCLFGIQNSTKPPWILGDTFLRSAYVVFDLVNNEIGLAATKFNDSDSNIVPFERHGSPIPSAKAIPSNSTITISAETAQPTSSLQASDGFKNDDENGSTRLMKPAGVLIGLLGMFFGVLL